MFTLSTLFIPIEWVINNIFIIKDKKALMQVKKYYHTIGIVSFLEVFFLPREVATSR